MRAPLTPSQITDLQARLTARTIIDPSGCISVQGAALHSGHVQFAIGARGQHIRVRAHVFVWEQTNGRTVPPGFVVMHSCDNPRCVNPEHLSVGSQAENIRDSIRKGRYNVFGIQKLNAAQVREIRARVAAGERQKDVALAFGVSRNNVSTIVARKTWAHLDPPEPSSQPLNAEPQQSFRPFDHPDVTFERVPQVELTVRGVLELAPPSQSHSR